VLFSLSLNDASHSVCRRSHILGPMSCAHPKLKNRMPMSLPASVCPNHRLFAKQISKTPPYFVKASTNASQPEVICKLSLSLVLARRMLKNSPGFSFVFESFLQSQSQGKANSSFSETFLMKKRNAPDLKMNHH